jgi:hypothetical protein
MYDQDEHLDNLLRHIELVRDYCTLLGKRLIKQGRHEFGQLLIARGHTHDATKFYGIEWDYLHRGPDTPHDELELAIKQHVRTNSHHPEFHGGIIHMPEVDVAEMVCDWYARGTEFGTNLRDWITDTAIGRYKIDLEGKQYAWINNFVDMLLRDPFSKKVKAEKAAI